MVKSKGCCCLFFKGSVNLVIIDLMVDVSVFIVLGCSLVGLIRLQTSEMKRQDVEESASQDSDNATSSTTGPMEPCAAGPDRPDSKSPEASQAQVPQTDTRSQSDEAASEGKHPNLWKTVKRICLSVTEESVNIWDPEKLKLSIVVHNILFYSILCLVAKAARSQRDMAEELSRQLEDILSTYCRESLSDDTLANGQSHSPEFNGMARVNDKPGEGKVIGANGEEREPRKSQEKKKVKGLGKRRFPSKNVVERGEKYHRIC